MIVGGRWRPVNESPGPIVVGVDGSDAAQSALTFAFEEAALRDAPQAVLHHAPCPVGIVHPSASQPSWRYPVWAR